MVRPLPDRSPIGSVLTSAIWPTGGSGVDAIPERVDVVLIVAGGWGECQLT